MTTAQLTASVERTARGWNGTLSNGKTAHITDGQSHWFNDDFAATGRLNDNEQAALDRATMLAIRNAR